MTANLYIDMTIEDYHAHATKKGDDMVLSKSMLDVFDDCPAKFEWRFLLGNEKPSTPQMRLGNAVHVRAFEPELFDKKYYILPLGEDGKQIRRDLRTKAYKEQLEIAAGRIDLQPSEMEQIDGMAASLKNNQKARLLLEKPGKAEASIFWTDAETGLKFRCRPDFMPDDGILVDLKSTGRADDDGFRRIAFDKHYDLSVALTARGYKALTGEWPLEYVFLLAETEPPYVIEGKFTFQACNYSGGKISKSYWQLGEERLSRILDRYMRCRETGHYPSYNDDFRPMVAPEYAVRKLYETEGDY